VFAHRSREVCTVGALRARAVDVDTTVRSRGKVHRNIRTMEQIASYMNR